MNRMSWLARFVVGLVLVLTAQAALASPTFPALTGKVVDEADVLSPETEAKLTQEITDLEGRTGHQVVVVTTSSLQGLDIEEYGILLGRKWGVGRKNANDGVLLIIAPNQRKLRIEVGYGLESTLTDEKAAAIIAKDIVPKFKAGNINGGAVAGTESILKTIDGPPLAAGDGGASAAPAAAPLASSQPAAAPPPMGSGGVSLMTVVLVALAVAVLVRMLSGGKTQVVYAGDPNAMAALNQMQMGGMPSGGASGGGGAAGMLLGTAAGAGGMLLANRIRNGSWLGSGRGGGGSSGGSLFSGGGGSSSSSSSGSSGYSGSGGGGGGSFGGGGASGSW